MPLPQEIPPSSIPPASPSVSPPPIPQSPSKLILVVALAVILALVLFAGYFYFQNYQKKPPYKPETQQKLSDKCVISQREFYKGDNTENDCQTCDPSISEYSWTSKKDGVSCHNNQGACLKGECLPILTPPTAGKEGAPAP